MGKPTAANSRVLIEHEGFSIRLARVGQGPLIQLWVHEDGNGGRGMIVDVAQSDEFINAWQDLLDEIDNDDHAFANEVRTLLHAEGIDRL